MFKDLAERMGRICLALIVVSGLATVARADVLAPSVRAHAVRRTGPISVDGKLDEPSWTTAPRQSGFVQRFPRDASKPSVETHFAIQYDDEAIYVAVWADDPQPELIRALLTRRDVDAPADAVTVAFDSYHDRRTAYAFQLNAAGVQRDMLLFDDSNQDDTWDAVWTGNVAVTPAGWTAEYRIPLSQLRFGSSENQEWGFQIVRLIGRTGEQDSWSPWPRSAPQVVSKFGVVDGIDNLRAGRRLELLPYVTTGVDRMPVEAGDPLNDQYGWRRNVGLDLKYGLGSAFTLSATINPDFGQVEADPSKVNLSANELFFAEKRPFFLEGVDLFKLPIGNSDNSVEGAFYSRRIGAAPPEPDTDFDFIRSPQSTTIYGAAKLTGKTSTGWSVGMLDAVTGQQKAETFKAAIADSPDQPGAPEVWASPVVAPLTNYAIARVKRDLGEGKTSIGMSATAVNRKLDDDRLAALIHDQAYTGGLQLQHRWADNAWTANVNLLGSWVHGSREAIAETQQSARHYFQRPDASDVDFDPNRTSMSGLAAKWMVGRLGDVKHWRFGAGGDLRTPGLELNDAGFQTNSDRVIPFFWGGYRNDEPSKHVLNWQFNSDLFWVQTFEPRLTDVGLESNGNIQFSNYWSMYGGSNLIRGRWNVNALRGGPARRRRQRHRPCRRHRSAGPGPGPHGPDRLRRRPSRDAHGDREGQSQRPGGRGRPQHLVHRHALVLRRDGGGRGAGVDDRVERLPLGGAARRNRGALRHQPDLLRVPQRGRAGDLGYRHVRDHPRRSDAPSPARHAAASPRRLRRGGPAHARPDSGAGRGVRTLGRAQGLRARNRGASTRDARRLAGHAAGARAVRLSDRHD